MAHCQLADVCALRSLDWGAVIDDLMVMFATLF
jgi:hypothetical protein